MFRLQLGSLSVRGVHICLVLFQVSIRILSIGQREEILRQGLSDRNPAVQKVVEKDLGITNIFFKFYLENYSGDPNYGLL